MACAVLPGMCESGDKKVYCIINDRKHAGAELCQAQAQLGKNSEAANKYNLETV